MIILWSCSDYTHREYRTYLGAWICGKWQFIKRRNGLRWRLRKLVNYHIPNWYASLLGLRYFDAQYNQDIKIVEFIDKDISGVTTRAILTKKQDKYQKGIVYKLAQDENGQFTGDPITREPKVYCEKGLYKWVQS